MSAAPMSLPQVSEPLTDVQLRGDAMVSDVAYRSSDCSEGSLFFCVPGLNVDGHDFAADAVSRGASALMVERWLPIEAPQALVPSVRAAMGPVSGRLFGDPCREMKVVGVTGTNGKTTTTYVLESIFRAAGMRPGVIGTTGIRVDGEEIPAEHTTPEAPDLHRLLRKMVDSGVTATAMEVSSHGLDQHRVGGMRYACAVFTNLSQDHLDYHETIEAYFLAKARLFTSEMAERAVVNHDSPFAHRLLGGDVPTTTYGLGEGADIRAKNVKVSWEGISFEVDGRTIRAQLRGSFNVENCLAAFAAARVLGIDVEATIRGIADLRGVPGRFEPVDEGQGFAVLVDYAHTPDGVENVLRSARPLTDERVIVVLGCGGDRDRGKRPLMGKAATTLADVTIITSDNPRTENPESIIAEIVPGAREGGGSFETEVDRRLAIRRAVELAHDGDVVVIAGKGHETGQQFADRTIPFDDRLVAAEEIREIGGSS